MVKFRIVGAALSLVVGALLAGAEPVRLIFDTDISPDFDDVGAMAVMHALADDGEAEILATVACNRTPLCVPVIEIINAHYGRAAIPVGVVREGGVSIDDQMHVRKWPEELAKKYAADIRHMTSVEASHAVAVYRKALAAAPDGSVTICAVGFLTNLADLLESPPDGLSPLCGRDLVARKVRSLYTMAGYEKGGREFNVYMDAVSSKKVFDRWPTKIVISPAELGNAIRTGKRVAALPDTHSPVRDAFALALSQADKDGRQSWDETTVYAAIRGGRELFSRERGRFVVTDEKGTNTWTPDPNGPHELLKLAVSPAQAEPTLEDLMVRTDETRRLQDEIDRVSEAGGGRVTVAKGVHRSGTLYLKSNVELHLEEGATLLGGSRSECYDDAIPLREVYSYADSHTNTVTRKAFIYAENATNIAITGKGVIDGQGPEFFDRNTALWGYFWAKPPCMRPRMVVLMNCRWIRFEETTFKDSPVWTMWLRHCEDITVSCIRIEAEQKIINSDGIDFDACRNVRVGDSHFRTGDDCIVLRAIRHGEQGDVITENVVVSNCVLDSKCQGVRIGCPSDDTIRNAVFQDIVFTGYNAIFADQQPQYLERGDRGRIRTENLVFENWKIDCEGFPISVVAHDKVVPRELGHMTFRDFEIRSKKPVVIKGNSEVKVRDIMLENVKIETFAPQPIVIENAVDIREVTRVDAVLGVGPVKILGGHQDGWSLAAASSSAPDGTGEVEIRLSSKNETIPPRFSVSFDVPQLDMHHRWFAEYERVTMPPDWAATVETRLGKSLPVIGFLNDNDRNRLTVSCSEAKRTVRIKAGLREEDCHVVWNCDFFSEPEAPLKEYAVRLRFDRRDVFFGEAISSGADWIAKTAALHPLTPPEAAFDPLYSAWYSFHQNVSDREIEAECAVAAKLGMKTVIVDDGWQTDDNNRGYQYTGDWQMSKKRFPDFAAHVKRVQAMGMKYMIWYSVPFVGPKSANYARFKGKYLGETRDHATLDPRFPEVREFLCGIYERAMREWGLDGLKLDFIDDIRFFGKDPAVAENYAGRDIKALPEAVNRLMTEASARIRAVKPDALIEFRQSYIGPAIRQYGNMLRAGDCPGDLLANRCRTANLRLTSGTSAVHADMLEWNVNDTPENAARFVLSTLFSVIQYSVMLRTLPESHRRMVAHWLDFSQKHRATLLKGVFRPRHFEAFYPVIEAESDAERIVAVYNDLAVAETGSADKPVFVINATGKDRLAVALAATPSEVEVFDTFGHSVPAPTLTAGLQSAAVPSSGYLRIVP